MEFCILPVQGTIFSSKSNFKIFSTCISINFDSRKRIHSPMGISKPLFPFDKVYKNRQCLSASQFKITAQITCLIKIINNILHEKINK